MSKKIRLTQKQYKELTDARDWAVMNGFTEGNDGGMAGWYNRLLSYYAWRRVLPVGAVEYGVEEDDVSSR